MLKKILLTNLFFLNLLVLQAQTDKVIQILGPNTSKTSIQTSSSVMDDSSHIIVTGNFSGSAWTNDSTHLVTSPYVNDIFLMKLDKNGNAIWQKCFGSPGIDQSKSVTTDNSNNIIVTGYFASSFSIDGNTVSGNAKQNPLLLKFDPAGKLVWSKTFQSNGNAYFYNVCCDPNGNIYVTAIIQASSFSIDGNNYSGMKSNAVLMKLNASGNIQWLKELSATKAAYITALVSDKNGGLYIGGQLSGKASYDQSMVNRPDTLPCAFVASLDNNGNIQWVKSGHAGIQGFISKIVQANDGSLVCGGILMDSLHFDNITYYTYNPGSYDQDIFLLNIDNTGNVKWGNHIGNANINYLNDIMCKDGHIYVAHTFEGTMHFGQDSFTATSYGDVMIIRYDSMGSIQRTAVSKGNFWYTETMGTSLMQNAGQVYLSGWMNGGTTLGGTSIDQHGLYDGFIWRVGDLYEDIRNTLTATGTAFIYPDPFVNELHIDQSTPAAGTLNLYDITGEKVFSTNISDMHNTIFTPGIAKGIYFVELISPSRRNVQKLIKD